VGSKQIKPDGWSQQSLLPESTIRAELVVWIDAANPQVYYGWHIATGDQLDVIEITALERVPLADLPIQLARVVERRMADLRNRMDPFPT